MKHLDNETILLINEKLNESQLERIFALKALKENPLILDNVFTFEKLVYVLNDIKPNVDFFEPPTILHIAKAIKFLLEEYPDHKWHFEINQYIAHIAHEEGWVILPTVLSFVQEALTELQKNKEIELDAEQLKIQELKHKAVEKYLSNK